MYYQHKIQAAGACAELAKVKEALNKALELAQGTAPKRQRVTPAAPGAP